MKKRVQYSVAVVATMSAGKSSLLNAMIGERLLPAKNVACTSNVFVIDDQDGAKTFYARAVDLGKEGPWEVATTERLAELNAGKHDRIEVYGDIRRIRNIGSDCSVRFFDTPGPNNSLDASHAEVTTKLMTDSDYCSLICVLNATALSTNDEFELLKYVKSQIASQRNKKVSLVFAINKIDTFDLDDDNGESIVRTLSNCRAYLEEQVGIKDPVLLPVSASLSLGIRDAFVTSRELTPEERGACSRLKHSRDLIAVSMQSDIAQAKLARLIEYYQRHEKEYLAGLKFSREVADVYRFCRMRKRGQLIIGGRQFSINDLIKVDLLSGIPVLETLIERRMKKFYKESKKWRNK